MSELQTAITNLQLKHSELVAAVKSYPGTVAGAANAAFGKASVEQRKARDTIRNLRNQIENDGQSLILDWEYDVALVNGEGKLLSEEVEFTRSTGGGRFRPDGKYEWVGPDVPRIDYDPLTGECLGLLVESQRTNLRTYSGDPSKWGNNTGFQEVSVPNPLGAPTVQKLMTRTSGYCSVVDDFHQPESTTHVRTYILKPDGISRVAFGRNAVDGARPAQVNLVTGEIRQNTDVWNVQSVTPLTADGWVAVTVIGSSDFGNGRYCKIYLVGDDASLNARHTDLAFEGDGISGVLFLAGQVEQGRFPSSYIPTEGSAVTRAADLAQRTLGNEYNRSDFTLYAEGVSYIPDLDGSVSYNGTAPLVTIQGGSNHQLGISRSDNTARVNKIATFIDGRGTGSASRSAEGADHSYPTGVFTKAALSISPTTITLASRGQIAAAVPLNGFINNTGVLRVGGNQSSARLNGHVKSVCLYPRALSESELQELTAQ